MMKKTSDLEMFDVVTKLLCMMCFLGMSILAGRKSNFVHNCVTD